MWRPGADRRRSRGRRRTLLGALLVVAAIVAGVVVITGSGSSAADDRRAVVRDVRALVRAAGTPDAQGDGPCALLSSDSRRRITDLADAATVSPDRRGCAAGLAAAPWRLKPVTAGHDVPESRWEVAIDGDRSTVRRGDAVLHLVRQSGHWRADLRADPVWSHRVVVADACISAGRTLAQLRLPAPTLAGVRRYLERSGRAMDVLARQVGRGHPPATLVATDRRLAAAATRAATRFRRAARRATDPRTIEAVVAGAAPDGFELVSQLPATVARRFRRAIGSCYTDTARVGDPDGVRVFQRRCSAGLRSMLRLLPARSVAGAKAVLRAGLQAVDELGRRIELLGVTRGQDPVRRATVREIRAVRTAYAEALRGGPSDPARVELAAVVANLGLRQLGTTCTAPDPGTRSAPIGSPA